MADLVVGLAKSVVEGALTKAQAAIEEEAKLRQSAQRNLVFITDEFQMMHSFLKVANTERVENPVVMTWVRQIRELAYDVEDCIDFVVHLDKKNRWWCRMIPSWCKAGAMPLDQAVSDIEQLKARVEDVSTRNARYSLISDTGSKPVVMQQQELLPGAAVAAAKFNMLAEARGATKRQQGFGDLTRLITKNDKGLQVISVWGAGGDHGTTSIIRKSFNHPGICKDFANRSWVKLMHPFRPQEFIRSMMAQFYANSASNQQTSTIGMHVLTKMKTTQADLFTEFERLVTEETYLVVLEGLTNMVDWDAIRTFLPDTKKGSWIIVSTQQPEISTLCVGHSYQISELQKFSDDHSVCALFKASEVAGGKDKKPVVMKGSQGDEDEGNSKSNTGPLVGRKSRMKELGEYPAMARANSPPVMSVWGIAGVGKTALVRNLFHIMRQTNQFDKYYWVDVSHPFNLRDLYMILLPDFHSERDPIEECHHLLMNTKCLIVIDDLWSAKEWDLMQAALVCKHPKSVIIVITTDASIAKQCTNNEDLVFNVKALETGDACDLFKNQVLKKNPLKIRDDEVQQLILKCGGIPKMIANPAMSQANPPPVMSVWGIAGVGKTALVKNLFDIMHQSNQFDKYYWVDISHPFNLRDLYMILLPDFHSEKDPIEECHHLLMNTRCLIVIDDLWSAKEWDLMQAALVCKHPKSVIIVITTEESIAKKCTNNEDLVFNVKALETSDASDLLKNQALKKNPLKIQDDEVQQLILKCGGIPKVIATIAGLLATKEKIMDTVRSLNRKFMHHLETDPEYDSLQDLFGWLHSYFRTCPDSLKPCIFYLSIFPRDHIIRRRRLIRRWIAEGYSRDSHTESAEENGEKHFSQLLELSIIQQLSSQSSSSTTSSVRMVLCQVNGFIREYIVSRQMEENLVFELGDKCALATQRTGRHLVILKNWNRDRIVFESIDFSRLRSLTVFGKWESFFISEGMKMLRVLDLEDASALNDSDLDKMVEWLRRLKFLSLRGHREIHHLPNSLERMRQLQTLDVRDTSIVTLPKSITKLHKLQYVRVGTTEVQPVTLSCFRRHRLLVGVEVPRGTGKMTALHTLGVVNIGISGTKVMVKELKKLTQLHKLGISGINMKNCKEFGESVHVAHLESLSVQLDKDNECCLDNISIPWLNLRSLKLYGLGGKLPKSIDQLSKLAKLDLEMAVLMQTDIDLLAKLPELCILRLAIKQPSIHFYVQMYGIEAKSYEKVRVLEIACSSSSLHVTFGSETMGNLELLKLDCSSALYRLSGLNCISQLKEVMLKGTNDEAMKKNLQRQLANHPKRPVVKLEELPRSS